MFPATADSEFEAESNTKTQDATLIIPANVSGNTTIIMSPTDKDNITSRSRVIYFPSRPSVSLADFKNLICPFSGLKSDNIERCFTCFKSLAVCFEFSDVQKFIFTERPLSGLTLLFIQSKTNLTFYAFLNCC